MVSTMEDEAIAAVSIFWLCAAMKLLKKRKVKRNCWTRPWIIRRNVFGAHHALLKELRREDLNRYKNF
jgi:hypothetical protein